MDPNAPAEGSVCGICGQPIDERHIAEGHPNAEEAGKRVQYVVVGRRGGIAEFRVAEVDSKVRKTDAATLAEQLGVEESSLVGRRFSCWVVPAEYGIISSDFRLEVD